MNWDSKEVIERINTYIKKGYISCGDHEIFSGFNRTYFSTNEYIKAYLDLVDFSNRKNALTVLGSGDQTFNLLNKGILNIDTFDINKLSEYYVFGLKRAMIIKYNYEDYLYNSSLLVNENTSFDVINDILYNLLPFMDTKYKKFWKEILDYNYNRQKNNTKKLNLLQMLFHNVRDVIDLNNYLTNDKEYNEMKNNINKANLSFKCINAIDIHKKFHNKYDLILLLNVMDYFYLKLGYEWDLKDYIKKLDCIANKDAVIFLHYIFQYYTETNIQNSCLIWGTNSSKEDLDNCDVEKLPYYNNDAVVGAGIILKKL